MPYQPRNPMHFRLPARPTPAGKPKRIQLPRSSTRLQLPYVYVKVIEDILPEPFGLCRFEGRIYKPGAVVDRLPSPAVLIECAGPIGPYRRGRRHREFLYILWTYDDSIDEWRELARSQSADATWTLGIREPAWRALHPRPELVDITIRSRDVTEEILEAIDRKLRMEMPEVKANALFSIYERVAGRLSECA